MIISMEDQVRLVFYSLASGILTGVLFDIYRLIRGFQNPNKFITLIEDTLFWILAAIVIFIFLLYTNHAFIEPYVYICIAVGLCFYLKLISKYFIKWNNFIINNIIKIIRIVNNILIYPFQLLIYTFKQKNKRNNKK